MQSSPSPPPFAGLNHSRVLRQKTRIGRLIGLSKEEVISEILRAPILAGYSFQRDLAAIDVFRNLETNGHNSRELYIIWRNHCAKSPYVPETNKLRISQARKQGNFNKPPLMTKVQTRLERMKI